MTMRSFLHLVLAFVTLILCVSAYWLEDISHQGLAPYAGSGYSVFRNVKDYGAKGKSLPETSEKKEEKKRTH